MPQHRHRWQYLGALKTGPYTLTDWCPCGTLRLQLDYVPGMPTRWHYRRPTEGTD